MPRLLLTTLILLTATAITLGQPSDRRPEMLLVGSWNIEGIESGSAQNTRIIAAHLRLLRFDILALNHVDGDAERKNRQLEAIFGKANEEEGSDWRYRLFVNKTTTDRTDLVGIAWNRNRVTLETEVFRTVTDDGDTWKKPPHAAKFSAGDGRTDIVVIPVQLEPKTRESDCLGGKRGEESRDLAALIRNARSHFGDDDIVVIGDTECVRDDAELASEFATERVLDIEVGEVAAFARGQGAYNRVMVPAGQPEFKPTRMYTLLEAEGQSPERPFSDHFLVLAPIRVMADDD